MYLEKLCVMIYHLVTILLSKAELALIAGHLKQHIELLLKFHKATPECVVWFLGGCFPTQVLLHLRQISLFSMISRLNDANKILASNARTQIHVCLC